MYDYHTSAEECAAFARQLGWKGIVLLSVPEDLHKAGEKGIVPGLLIESGRIADVQKLLAKHRKDAVIIAAKGGDVELNRQLFSLPRLDIVSGVSSTQNMDYVMCRTARENGVAVEFAFSDLLHSFGKSRAEMLANMKRSAALVRKEKSPFVLVSSALSKWDMRSPHDMIVFGRTLGFGDKEIKTALSSRLIDDNRKKISGNKFGNMERL